MTELSPAAQAVLDALCLEELNGPQQILARAHAAAALRAAADQVVPAPHCPYHSCCDVYAAAIRAEFLAIAKEIEAQ